ncbi:MAG: hypothetical protein LAP61_07930 [Acidobacteriia bacterium]|nr:hypothetical protein [Terriglobia bacterium]
MSWSDDTRCLYCEGRLPLYRKITHGQFCSSAHRKAYWQEHERLAVERLHQTHSSLRSYRSLEVQQEVEVQQEAFQEAASYPELESVTQTQVATHPELEMDLDLDPTPSFDVNLYPIPEVSEPPMAASELLALLGPGFTVVGGSAPELLAADPFEYETTLQPVSPSHPSSLGTSPLPANLPVAVWSYIGSRPSDVKKAAGSASVECEVEVCHPRSPEPAVSVRAAGRIGLPLTAAQGTRTAGASATGSRLQVLQMEPAVVTSVELEVPLQSDVLLQLLDQQMPHPDQMQELGSFAAHQQAWVPACPPPQQFDATPGTLLPAAASPAGTPEYQLVSSTELLELSAVVLPAQGTAVGRTAISEIAVNPQTGLAAAAMPPAQAPGFQMDMAGLQSLLSNLSRPVPGTFARQANNFPSFDLSKGTSPDVTSSSLTSLAREASAYQMDLAGLLPLRSNSTRPAQGVFARQTAESLAFDLSMGVSSDVTYPRMVSMGALVETIEPPLFAGMLPLTFARKRRAAADAPQVEPIARLLPQAVETHPMLPVSGLEPLDRKTPQEELRQPGNGIGSLMRGDGLGKLEPAWAHATGFWNHAPRDLKLLLFAIPALLALVFHPGLPRVAFAAPQSSTNLSGGFKRVLGTEWMNVRQTLENRAAVALDEDFRSGLDNWASPGGSTTEWSFDQTGFVRPGPLALYRPSVNLTDYQVQFLGLIDKKALSWVVRAADFENFYVVKLEVLKPGPMPTIGLTRYAVINGKARDRHDVAIPLSVRADTVYRVLMNVQGNDFSVEVQGQIADSWTETRLPRGGIGFFTASGEASRLRWMQITHQYDMLGRLCAYLAPYDTTNGSWQP